MHRTVIRKFSAFILLAVFVLCNTPTYALHTLFANHKDIHTEMDSHNPFPQVAATGIDCHCISNVTTAPYLPGQADWVSILPQQYFEFKLNLTCNIISTTTFHADLRGPPVWK